MATRFPLFPLINQGTVLSVIKVDQETKTRFLSLNCVCSNSEKKLNAASISAPPAI